MKKILLLSFSLFFILGCMTTIHFSERKQYFPDRTLDSVYQNAVGDFNISMTEYQDRIKNLTEKYNKKIVANNSWYVSETILASAGAAVSGGLALAKQSTDVVAIPISISSIVTTLSIAVRQSIFSKSISDDLEVVLRYQEKLRSFDDRFAVIREKFESSSDEKIKKEQIELLKGLVIDVNKELNSPS